MRVLLSDLFKYTTGSYPSHFWPTGFHVISPWILDKTCPNGVITTINTAHHNI